MAASNDTPPIDEADRFAGHDHTVSRRLRLFSGLRLVSTLTLLSRVLGLVRDVGMATLFGNGMVLDAFTIAFRLPNLARRLFGEGALSTAFIPIFLRESEQSGRSAAWRLTSAVFLVLALSLSVFVLVAELAIWCVTHFGVSGMEIKLLLGLTAAMFPYLVLICLAAQVGAVLQALEHFTWPAMLPILLNVGWIAAIWWLTPCFATPQAKSYALSAAIVALGCVQLAAPWPTLRRFGFRFDFNWRATRDCVAEIVRIMLPIVVGLSITQLNTLCDSLIAWSFSAPESSTAAGSVWHSSAYPLQSGTASALYFGQRLYQFPLGVFGVALGTVLFPLLSQHAARGELSKLRDDLMLGMRLIVVIGFPASLGLVLLAHPITVLLFQYGAFDGADTQQTSEMIAMYGIGVWAYCGLLIVHRGFYALGDRMTPVRVGTAIVLLNVVLNLVLIWFLGGKGLALSTAVCAIIQLTVIVLGLQHRLGRMSWPMLGSVLWRAFLATLMMSIVCLITLNCVGTGLSLTARMTRVLVPLGLSILSYLAAARFLRLDEIWLLFQRGH